MTQHSRLSFARDVVDSAFAEYGVDITSVDNPIAYVLLTLENNHLLVDPPVGVEPEEWRVRVQEAMLEALRRIA